MNDSKKLSAGIVPFRRENQKVQFLILRSYRYWDFPKGLVEIEEAPFQTALRELKEETSLENVNFPFGGIFCETEPYAQGKVARYYLGEIKNGLVCLPLSEELGRPEHHEFRWASAAEARTLLGPRLRKVLDWAEDQIHST